MCPKYRDEVATEEQSGQRTDRSQPVSMISMRLVAGLLLATTSIPANAAVGTLRPCTTEVLLRTDVTDQVSLTKLVLNGDHLRAWVTLTAYDSPWATSPARLDERWGLGYELDKSTVTGVQPLTRASSLTMVLSFRNLKKGRHRLRIGFSSPDGQLDADSTYCFASPGTFTLTSP